MRLKNLFTVPKGQKVTEKYLRRVLVSSICSILLCMSCLISTTWAWFAVSIENTGNEIQIAMVTANVEVVSGEGTIPPNPDGSYALNAGAYSIRIGLEQEEETADGANLLNDPKCPVYVIMAINREEGMMFQSFEFTGKEEVKNYQLTIGNGSAEISFSVSWVMPVGAPLVSDEAGAIGEVPTEPTTEPSADGTTTPTTEKSVDETTSTQQETEPTESGLTETTTATDSATETTDTASAESTGETDAVA